MKIAINTSCAVAGGAITQLRHVLPAMIRLAGGDEILVIGDSKTRAAVALGHATPQGRGSLSGYDDSIMAMLFYPDGSTATISYLASASLSLPKERWGMRADGKSGICDNFRTTLLPNGKKHRGLNQDKGQERVVRECLTAVRRAMMLRFHWIRSLRNLV